MQRPKLRPYIDAMRAEIATCVRIPADCVSVKATTTERMGFEGEERGVSATAIALIERN
jgi:2-C-methyl-D-erythritol 2,4-cyclodiphosphate synthase